MREAILIFVLLIMAVLNILFIGWLVRRQLALLDLVYRNLTGAF